MVETIKDLLFMGYPKYEYDLLPDGLLRAARKAFKLQIKTVTKFSLFVSLSALAMFLFGVLILGIDIKNVNFTMVYGAVVIFVLTLVSIKSKIASLLNAVFYLVSSGYILFKSLGTALLVACILGFVFYVKVFFAHIHLGYIKKRGNIDGISTVKQIVKGSDNVNESLKLLFEAHQVNDNMTNDKALLFQNKFGVDLGVDDLHDDSKPTVKDLLGLPDVDMNFQKPDFNEEIDKVKKKFGEITDKLAGVEKEEKSRLEWYSYMNNNDKE